VFFERPGDNVKNFFFFNNYSARMLDPCKFFYSTLICSCGARLHSKLIFKGYLEKLYG
jgi:hypothetical protein